MVSSRRAEHYVWIGILVLIVVVVVVSMSSPAPSTRTPDVDDGFDLTDLFDGQVSETFDEIGSSLD